jgi:hypothetical protein
MKRREFLTKTATAGVGAASTAATGGCGLWITGAPLPRSRREPVDLEAYLARIDSGMAQVAERSVLGAVLAGRETTPTEARRFAECEALARSSLRSLFFTGMLRDLPEADQRHPEVQQRLWRHLPEMAEALSRMTELLEGLDAGDLDRMSTVLAADPHLPRHVCEQLEREAADIGATEAVRAQLLALGEELDHRLGRQPPELLIREVLSKAERLKAGARRRHPDLEDQLAANVELAQRSAPPSPAGLVTARQSGGALGGRAQPRRRAGSSDFTGALVTLGLGLWLLLFGLAVGGNGLFVGTVGALLVLVGLIWLIIEAIT